MQDSLSCGFPLTMFSVCQSCLDLLTSLESELNLLSASPQPFLVFVNLCNLRNKILSQDVYLSLVMILICAFNYVPEHIARKDEME